MSKEFQSSPAFKAEHVHREDAMSASEDKSSSFESPAFALEKDAPKGYVATSDEQKALDKHLNRKLDLAVLPLLAWGFLLCGIDKTNIGNAATNGFAAKAGISPDDITDSISLLSVTFVTLQPFAVAVGRRIGPKIFLPTIMCLWGAVTMLHACVWNRGTLIALRLLLGVLESGYFPSCMFLLSTYYPRYNLALRLGIFAGCYAGAGAFSGLIAYGVFQIPETKLYGYQTLFLLEGGVTVLTSFATYFLLPKSMETAWFLNAEERVQCVERMRLDSAMFVHGPVANSAAAKGKASGTTWRDVKDALDWKKLLTVVANICATLPVSAFGFLAPVVVKGMGYSSVDANLMTVPPFIIAALGIVCFVYSSDHRRERSLHACAGMTLAIVGLSVMVGSQNNKLRYGFLHVCLAGAFAAGPLIVGWLAGNTPEPGPRGIVIGINGYSNLAGVIAGQLYKTKYGPTYKFPLTVTMCMLVAGIFIFLAVRLILMRINKQRRAAVAAMDPDEIEAERLSDVRRGDQKKTFIYGL